MTQARDAVLREEQVNSPRAVCTTPRAPTLVQCECLGQAASERESRVSVGVVSLGPKRAVCSSPGGCLRPVCVQRPRGEEYGVQGDLAAGHYRHGCWSPAGACCWGFWGSTLEDCRSAVPTATPTPAQALEQIGVQKRLMMRHRCWGLQPQCRET